MISFVSIAKTWDDVDKEMSIGCGENLLGSRRFQLELSAL